MKSSRRKKVTAPVTVELACLECGSRAAPELSAREFQGLSAAWKLTRPCLTCGRPTDWSFAEARVDAKEQADFWDWLATTGVYFTPPGAPPQYERREEPRVELEVPLRVATVGGDEEAVTSENISQSGLCFTSSKAYGQGETLLITLKPAGAVAPQTKRGNVVRFSPAGGGRTRYGIRLVE